MNIATQTYDTAEALMRIVLPDVGMVYPDVFIPIAEENRIIHQLTLIILYKTCVQIKAMMEQGYRIVRISVNISAQELREECFCLDISSVIRKAGVPFGKVAIELTESQNEGDFMIMKSKIEELRESGIKFYLDDFGTGYSNFERIMELPFDIIKVDRSFVTRIEEDAQERELMMYFSGLASTFGAHVCVEGIETAGMVKILQDYSVHSFQGYYYSKPLEIDAFMDWKRNR